MVVEIVFMWLGVNVGCCFIGLDIELYFRYYLFNVYGICNKFKFDII